MPDVGPSSEPPGGIDPVARLVEAAKAAMPLLFVYLYSSNKGEGPEEEVFHNLRVAIMGLDPSFTFPAFHTDPRLQSDAGLLHNRHSHRDPERRDRQGIRTLSRGDHTVSLSNVDWERILEIALEAGWQPAGTLTPEDWHEFTEDPWDGNYYEAYDQTFSDADAAAFSRCLFIAWEEKGPEEPLSFLIQDVAILASDGGFRLDLDD